MTTASALLEVFKTLPSKSKKEFVYLLTEENEQTNLFIKSFERGLKEVKAIESGEKKGRMLNVKSEESKSSKTKKKSKMSTFFGVFEDIGSEEMIRSIEESRTTKNIDTSWAK